MSEQLLGDIDNRSPVGTEKYKQYKFSTGHSVHLTDEEVAELVEQAKRPVVKYLHLDGQSYLLPWVLDALHEQYGVNLTENQLNNINNT